MTFRKFLKQSWKYFFKYFFGVILGFFFYLWTVSTALNIFGIGIGAWAFLIGLGFGVGFLGLIIGCSILLDRFLDWLNEKE